MTVYDDEKIATALIETQRLFYGSAIARRDQLLKLQSDKITMLEDAVTHERMHSSNMKDENAALVEQAAKPWVCQSCEDMRRGGSEFISDREAAIDRSFESR